MKVWARSVLAAAAVGTALCAAVAAPAGGQGVTALAVQAPGPPRYVHASDGRVHIEYDLLITNTLPLEATLKSLLVRTGKRRVLRLRGGALASHVVDISTFRPTLAIGPGATVVALVDITLPRSARRVPKRLSNQIRYGLAPGPSQSIVGSYTVNHPNLIVDRRRPALIAPPLRGSGWSTENACCDPSNPHRHVVLAANGTYKTFEMFAIDWYRLLNGNDHRGAGTRLTDYYAYGAPIHAVADGTVAAIHRGLPDAPPPPASPVVTRPEDFGGNSVVLRIGRRKYAYYAHMAPRSIRVRVGQRLRSGQVIGRLGNSGNSTGPHLHFSISDGPNPLTSNALPFVIDRFRLQGVLNPESAPPAVSLIGPSRQERRTYPLTNTVVSFPRHAR
jgi:hypothetical protein